MKKIKVCGMRNEANIRQLEKLKPDFMGFIFYPKSPRFVGKKPEIPDVSPGIIKVGVFVDEDSATIIELAKQHDLDYVQLHSGEDVSSCKIIKDAGLGVIKVVSIANDFDFKTLEPFNDVADYFLFDTAGQSYGGHGKTFDWNILSGYHLDVPFLVAGGISLDNVDELLGMNLPQFVGIDVNSKFEISPGIKDIELLNKLFLKVRNN